MLNWMVMSVTMGTRDVAAREREREERERERDREGEGAIVSGNS